MACPVREIVLQKTERNSISLPDDLTYNIKAAS